MSNLSCLLKAPTFLFQELNRCISDDDAKHHRETLHELTMLDVMALRVQEEGLWDGCPQQIAATMLADRPYLVNR